MGVVPDLAGQVLCELEGAVDRGERGDHRVGCAYCLKTGSVKRTVVRYTLTPERGSKNLAHGILRTPLQTEGAGAGGPVCVGGRRDDHRG